MNRVLTIMAAVCVLAAAGCSEDTLSGPVIAVGGNDNLVDVPLAGGQQKISYSVSGALAGWSMTYETDAEWIVGISDDAASSTITFAVAPNDGNPERMASIRLTCSDKSGRSGSAVIVVRQEGETVYDVEDDIIQCAILGAEAVNDNIIRYIMRFSPDADWTEMSSLSDDVHYYTFYLNSVVREDGLDMPADGTYTASYDSERPFTFSSAESYYYYSDSSSSDDSYRASHYFLSGTLEIEAWQGENGYMASVEGFLTDGSGTRYHFTFL